MAYDRTNQLTERLNLVNAFCIFPISIIIIYGLHFTQTKNQRNKKRKMIPNLLANSWLLQQFSVYQGRKCKSFDFVSSNTEVGQLNNNKGNVLGFRSAILKTELPMVFRQIQFNQRNNSDSCQNFSGIGLVSVEKFITEKIVLFLTLKPINLKKLSIYK